jgi:Polyketide cyclase / dehydrase and lipid transport
MKWLLIVVVGLAVVAGVIAIIGTLLPRGHSASRSATFVVPPETVWQAITDVDAFPAWRAGVKSVRPLPDREGRKAWVEETTSGAIPLVVERSEAPRLLVLRIADPDLPFGGTWTYQVTPAPGGSAMTITEDGEVYNPIFRFMARFVFGYEATMASYLSSLEKRLAKAS